MDSTGDAERWWDLHGDSDSCNPCADRGDGGYCEWCQKAVFSLAELLEDAYELGYQDGIDDADD